MQFDRSAAGAMAATPSEVRHIVLRPWRRVAIGACAAAGCAVLLSFAARQQIEQRLRSAAAEVEGLEADLGNLVTAAATAAAAAQAQLPTPMWAGRDGVQRVLADVQRAASDRGIAVLSMTTASGSAAWPSDATHELALVMQGDYRSIRAALGEVLDRNHSLTLQRLAISRVPSSPLLEARVSLLLERVPAATVMPSEVSAPGSSR